MEIKEAVALLRFDAILENEASGYQYRHMNGILEVYVNERWVESRLSLLDFADINFIIPKEKPFNLSDKVDIPVSMTIGNDNKINCGEWCKVEDIKEFIKQVKEGIKNKNYHQDCIDEISELIGELAGPRFKE